MRRYVGSCGWRQDAKRSRAAPQPVGQDDGKSGLRSYDAGKKVKGRKRHLLVDTLGLVWGVVVHVADVQDRDGAKLVLEKVRVIWADGGYGGQLVGWVETRCGWVLDIIQRSIRSSGFESLGCGAYLCLVGEVSSSE